MYFERMRQLLYSRQNLRKGKEKEIFIRVITSFLMKLNTLQADYHSNYHHFRQNLLLEQLFL